jgi:hypothetical protein
VAERPEAIPSFGNKMGALSRLLRAMMMRAPNTDALQRDLNHPPMSNPTFAQHTNEWNQTHHQSAKPIPIRAA